DRIELLRPDVVRVDGRRFRRLAAVAGAATLFRSLVAGLRERGAKVLVDGIDTPAQLEYALHANADFFQGPLLSRPRLAGTIFESEPIDLKALLGHEANIVHLFR